jgi:DNA-binding GntR family transcriptional regulator
MQDAGETMADSSTQTRAEKLASDIADAILAGEFEPGTKLDEQTLADRYKVSRTPVREALRQLGPTGLVETRPRRGTTVAVITTEKLEEIFVAMGEIEATCARLSAISMTPIERRRLGALHEQMAGYVRKNDHASYTEANVAFHGAIYAGSHNTVIAEIALGLRRRLSPYRRAQFRSPGRLPRSHAEHDSVVKAILRADADAAHAAMLHHVSLIEDAVGKLAASTRGISKAGRKPLRRASAR